MSTQTPDYPVEYRGNMIKDEKRVSELNKPNLQLVQNQEKINQILEHIGVTQDKDSIVLEDSYGCLWVDTAHGSYTEVWGIHKNVPTLSRIAVRLK